MQCTNSFTLKTSYTDPTLNLKGQIGVFFLYKYCKKVFSHSCSSSHTCTHNPSQAYPQLSQCLYVCFFILNAASHTPCPPDLSPPFFGHSLTVLHPSYIVAPKYAHSAQGKGNITCYLSRFFLCIYFKQNIRNLHGKHFSSSHKPLLCF